MFNVVSILVSSIILIYGLLSPAPGYIKILLVVALGVPLMCSIGTMKNR